MKNKNLTKITSLIILLAILCTCFAAIPAIAAEGSADLTVTEVSAMNDGICDGDTTRLYATVRNSGSVDATNPTVSFAVGGSPLETVKYSGKIKAGEQKTVVTDKSWDAMIGTYKMLAYVNSDKSITEASYGNNICAQLIAVSESEDVTPPAVTTESITEATTESITDAATEPTDILSAGNTSDVYVAAVDSVSGSGGVVAGCAEGGKFIASLVANDSYEYKVNIPKSGLYNIDLRATGEATVNFYDGDKFLNSIAFASEGRNIMINATGNAEFSAGEHIIRMTVSKGNCSIYYFDLQLATEYSVDDNRITTESGTGLEFTTDGTRFDIIGSGAISVYVDGRYMGFYSGNGPVLYSETNLGKGLHKVEIIGTNNSNLNISSVRVSKTNLKNIGSVETDDIKVACIGDSITYGVGTSSEANAYPSQLASLLGDGYMVRNYGRGGSMILTDYSYDYGYWNYRMYREVEPYQPDVIIIMLGTNDLRNGYDQNTGKWSLAHNYEAALNAMVEYYGGFESRPQIYLNVIPTFYDDNAIFNAGVSNYIRPIYDRVIENATKKDIKISSIDVYSATAGMAENYFDAVHPNDAGAAVIANTVFNGAFPYYTARKNLALNKPIISYSSKFMEYDPEYINDGTSAGWASANGALTGRNEYVVIDLQSVCGVSSISLVNNGQYPMNSVRDFEIYGSVSGNFSGEEVLLTSGHFDAIYGGEKRSYKFDTANVRYIKFKGTSATGVGYVFLGELRVFE